jgi:hypothetical protein
LIRLSNLVYKIAKYSEVRTVPYGTFVLNNSEKTSRYVKILISKTTKEMNHCKCWHFKDKKINNGSPADLELAHLCVWASFEPPMEAKSVSIKLAILELRGRFQQRLQVKTDFRA